MAVEKCDGITKLWVKLRVKVCVLGLSSYCQALVQVPVQVSSGPDPLILKSLTMHDSVTKILNGISLDLTFWGQLRFLKAGITQIKGIPAGFVKTFLMLE